MNIGLIDVDGHNFPNLALMKLSAWHKAKGDDVRWCKDGLYPYDRVYMSKVFSFSEEPEFYPNAKEIVKGGTGYQIRVENGVEVYDKDTDHVLPYEVEHIYPDYGLYGITDTAYGFMSRGCPKGLIHKYCHVAAKEGLCSHKVTDLDEFWRGQKYIELMDPNTLACREWESILGQLVDSKAWVNFNQGVDIQLLTKEKAQYLKSIKVSHVHFAWDNYEDKKIVIPAFETLINETNWGRSKVSAYVLVNFNTTIEQDLERIYFLRSLNIQPYPMIYNKGEFFTKNGKLKSKKELKRFSKEQIEHAKVCQKIQRWCNPYVFWSCPKFEDYNVGKNGG